MVYGNVRPFCKVHCDEQRKRNIVRFARGFLMVIACIMGFFNLPIAEGRGENMDDYIFPFKDTIIYAGKRYVAVAELPRLCREYCARHFDSVKEVNPSLYVPQKFDLADVHDVFAAIIGNDDPLYAIGSAKKVLARHGDILRRERMKVAVLVFTSTNQLVRETIYYKTRPTNIVATAVTLTKDGTRGGAILGNAEKAIIEVPRVVQIAPISMKALENHLSRIHPTEPLALLGGLRVLYVTCTVHDAEREYLQAHKYVNRMGMQFIYKGSVSHKITVSPSDSAAAVGGIVEISVRHIWTCMRNRMYYRSYRTLTSRPDRTHVPVEEKVIGGSERVNREVKNKRCVRRNSGAVKCKSSSTYGDSRNGGVTFQTQGVESKKREAPLLSMIAELFEESSEELPPSVLHLMEAIVLRKASDEASSAAAIRDVEGSLVTAVRTDDTIEAIGTPADDFDASVWQIAVKASGTADEGRDEMSTALVGPLGPSGCQMWDSEEVAVLADFLCATSFAEDQTALSPDLSAVELQIIPGSEFSVYALVVLIWVQEGTALLREAEESGAIWAAQLVVDAFVLEPGSAALTPRVLYASGVVAVTPKEPTVTGEASQGASEEKEDSDRLHLAICMDKALVVKVCSTGGASTCGTPRAIAPPDEATREASSADEFWSEQATSDVMLAPTIQASLEAEPLPSHLADAPSEGTPQPAEASAASIPVSSTDPAIGMGKVMVSLPPAMSSPAVSADVSICFASETGRSLSTLMQITEGVAGESILEDEAVPATAEDADSVAGSSTLIETMTSKAAVRPRQVTKRDNVMFRISHSLEKSPAAQADDMLLPVHVGGTSDQPIWRTSSKEREAESSAFVVELEVSAVVPQSPSVGESEVVSFKSYGVTEGEVCSAASGSKFVALPMSSAKVDKGSTESMGTEVSLTGSQCQDLFTASVRSLTSYFSTRVEVLLSTLPLESVTSVKLEKDSVVVEQEEAFAMRVSELLAVSSCPLPGESPMQSLVELQEVTRSVDSSERPNCGKDLLSGAVLKGSAQPQGTEPVTTTLQMTVEGRSEATVSTIVEETGQGEDAMDPSACRQVSEVAPIESGQARESRRETMATTPEGRPEGKSPGDIKFVGQLFTPSVAGAQEPEPSKTVTPAVGIDSLAERSAPASSELRETIEEMMQMSTVDATPDYGKSGKKEAVFSSTTPHVNREAFARSPLESAIAVDVSTPTAEKPVCPSDVIISEVLVGRSRGVSPQLGNTGEGSSDQVEHASTHPPAQRSPLRTEVARKSDARLTAKQSEEAVGVGSNFVGVIQAGISPSGVVNAVSEEPTAQAEASKVASQEETMPKWCSTKHLDEAPFADVLSTEDTPIVVTPQAIVPWDAPSTEVSLDADTVRSAEVNLYLQAVEMSLPAHVASTSGSLMLRAPREEDREEESSTGVGTPEVRAVEAESLTADESESASSVPIWVEGQVCSAVSSRESMKAEVALTSTTSHGMSNANVELFASYFCATVEASAMPTVIVTPADQSDAQDTASAEMSSGEKETVGFRKEEVFAPIASELPVVSHSVSSEGLLVPSVIESLGPSVSFDSSKRKLVAQGMTLSSKVALDGSLQPPEKGLVKTTPQMTVESSLEVTVSTTVEGTGRAEDAVVPSAALKVNVVAKVSHRPTKEATSMVTASTSLFPETAVHLAEDTVKEVGTPVSVLDLDVEEEDTRHLQSGIGQVPPPRASDLPTVSEKTGAQMVPSERPGRIGDDGEDVEKTLPPHIFPEQVQPSEAPTLIQRSVYTLSTSASVSSSVQPARSRATASVSSSMKPAKSRVGVEGKSDTSTPSGVAAGPSTTASATVTVLESSCSTEARTASSPSGSTPSTSSADIPVLTVVISASATASSTGVKSTAPTIVALESTAARTITTMTTPSIDSTALEYELPSASVTLKATVTSTAAITPVGSPFPTTSTVASVGVRTSSSKVVPNSRASASMSGSQTPAPSTSCAVTSATFMSLLPAPPAMASTALAPITISATASSPALNKQTEAPCESLAMCKPVTASITPTPSPFVSQSPVEGFTFQGFKAAPVAIVTSEYDEEVSMEARAHVTPALTEIVVRRGSQIMVPQEPGAKPVSALDVDAALFSRRNRALSKERRRRRSERRSRRRYEVRRARGRKKAGRTRGRKKAGRTRGRKKAGRTRGRKKAHRTRGRNEAPVVMGAAVAVEKTTEESSITASPLVSVVPSSSLSAAPPTEASRTNEMGMVKFRWALPLGVLFFLVSVAARKAMQRCRLCRGRARAELPL